MPDLGAAVATYTAPASKALTELHIHDPDTEPGEKPEPHGGQTRCGVLMAVADLWVTVEKRPGDRVCQGCQGISGDEQGMLL
jgi:hypothetical protein